MSQAMLPQLVSTASYCRRLYGFVTTANMLPEAWNKSAMNKLLEQELISNVLWEKNHSSKMLSLSWTLLS
ncbi:hypothetical protein BDR06DRAFT_958741, partial [Suillus hirtellus]